MAVSTTNKYRSQPNVRSYGQLARPQLFYWHYGMAIVVVPPMYSLLSLQ